MNGADDFLRQIPSTRYQGSKRRILPWIYENIKDLPFETVLDGFGGTASASFLFKLMGKKVTFNDVLLSNYQTGIALIENNAVTLNEADVEFLLNENGFEYPSFIQDTFKEIYYTDLENEWLDIASHNIHKLSQTYEGRTLKIKRALAYHILFQACLTKRPFNLFHRKNLYLRLAKVKRSFGNKVTWEREFQKLFMKFNNEISSKIFSNKLRNKATCKDILEVKTKGFDLVYFDPPYARPKDTSPKDYYSLYHFLEGIVDYKNWSKRIDWTMKNRRLIREKTKWEQGELIDNFDSLFRRFQDSIIVVSYGEPGNPSVERIRECLHLYKSDVEISRKRYKYRLNQGNNQNLNEVLLIGK